MTMNQNPLNDITRKFLQCEGAVPAPQISAYLQALEDTLSSFSPKTQMDQRRLSAAFEQLKQVRRLVNRLESQISTLEEANHALEESITKAVE